MCADQVFDLEGGAKQVFRQNFLVVYQNLKDAITEYKSAGDFSGSTIQIDAYLAASLHALVNYSERYFDKSEEIFKACKYANNTQKHNLLLVTHKKVTGGFRFPISFPFVIEKIEIVWNYDDRVTAKHMDQQNAFKRLFSGKPILDTLQPIAERIEKDYEKP